MGIIYEARPNVTADAFALCFKTGNAVILRGGSDAINSNRAMVSCIRDGLKKCGIPEDSVQLITDTSRETATGFMRLNGYLDVLIPRGGAGLIRSVVENSTVPVIETGTGNCHVYVDESWQTWIWPWILCSMLRPSASASATPVNPCWSTGTRQNASSRV